jgi:hypothetical protein
MSITTDEARAMGQVAERVLARFPDATPEQISMIVEQVHHEYDGRPIREFVPVLVEREVISTLRSR